MAACISTHLACAHARKHVQTHVAGVCVCIGSNDVCSHACTHVCTHDEPHVLSQGTLPARAAATTVDCHVRRHTNTHMPQTCRHTCLHTCLHTRVCATHAGSTSRQATGTSQAATRHGWAIGQPATRQRAVEQRGYKACCPITPLPYMACYPVAWSTALWPAAL